MLLTPLGLLIQLHKQGLSQLQNLIHHFQRDLDLQEFQRPKRRLRHHLY